MPLDVVVDGVRHVEGVDLTPDQLLDALTRGARVTTSQPPPAAFADAYARAAAAGAREIVSVHLSGELSGTVRAARLAAAAAPVPVHVVDSRTAAMGLGFAVLAAARLAASAAPPAAVPVATSSRRRPFDVGRWWRSRTAAVAAGPSGEAVANRAREVAARTQVWFLVDSLEHLRRGGRLGAAAAAIGTVLGLRPLLTVRDGAVVVAERVRTRRAARDRLQALAVAAVADRPTARVAVHHLARPDVAAEVAAQVGAWAGERVVETVVSESGAVIAAHVGPGLLAVVVSDA